MFPPGTELMPSKTAVRRHLQRNWLWVLTVVAAMTCGGVMKAPAQAQTPSSLPGQNTATSGASATASSAQGAPTSSGGIPPAPGQAPAPYSLSGYGGSTGNLEFFELRAFSNLTRVTGAARDRSFLTPGNNNDFDFSYLQDF